MNRFLGFSIDSTNDSCYDKKYSSVMVMASRMCSRGVMRSVFNHSRAEVVALLRRDGDFDVMMVVLVMLVTLEAYSSAVRGQTFFGMSGRLLGPVLTENRFSVFHSIKRKIGP